MYDYIEININIKMLPSRPLQTTLAQSRGNYVPRESPLIRPLGQVLFRNLLLADSTFPIDSGQYPIPSLVSLPLDPCNDVNSPLSSTAPLPQGTSAFAVYPSSLRGMACPTFPSAA